MRRMFVPLIAVVALLAGTLFALDRTSLLVQVGSDGRSGMAPAIPGCDGRVVAEGFTFWFRDPRRGEIVAFHAKGSLGGTVTPDSGARDLDLTGRVVGIPDDQVAGREGAVFVNGLKVDDLKTAPFKEVDLGHDQFYVLGDNRSAAQDSRDFGPVPGDAIFGRVFLVFWPLGDFGPEEGRHPGAPPGELCGPE